VEEALAILSELGVEVIEIFFNTESEFDPRFYGRLGDNAARLGIEVVSIHPYTSIMEGLLLFSDYRRRTEDALKQYGHYFDCASALGAKFLTFHGERDMGAPDTTERWKRKVDVYHQLCSLGESKGVTLAQENVAWCRSKEPGYIRTLYRDVPELRYTLDVKQARRAGKDWREFVEVEGNRLVNIHINDYSQDKSCLLPGRGVINYGEFFHHIRETGYNGCALIEVYKSDYTIPSELKEAARLLETFV